MKFRIFVLLTLLIFSLPSFAEVILIKANFEVNSEYGDFDEDAVIRDGWIKHIDERYDDTYYTIELEIDKSQLPLKKYLGEAYLYVLKNGMIQFGMSVGDADHGAESEIQLPISEGQFLPFPSIDIQTWGGDYASGVWSFKGRIQVEVRS